MRLENKIALISGGARGIGAAITRIFAQEGAKLVIGDVLEEEGRRTAEEVTTGGGECFFVRLDVTSEPDWERAAGEVMIRIGKLDILVNNAGVSARGNVEETSEADWIRTMDRRRNRPPARHLERLRRQQGSGADIQQVHGHPIRQGKHPL